MLRAVQEGVTNFVRHSNGSELQIEVQLQAQQWHVTMVDNGSIGKVQLGNGLSGMRERVEELGGQWQLDHRTGWRLTLVLPRATQ